MYMIMLQVFVSQLHSYTKTIIYYLFINLQTNFYYQYSIYSLLQSIFYVQYTFNPYLCPSPGLHLCNSASNYLLKLRYHQLPHTNFYRVKADGFDNRYCGYSECQPSMKLSIEASKCQYASCQSKVCLSQGILSSCDRQTIECSTPRWVYQTCGDCTNQLGCDKCILMASDFGDLTQSCQSSCVNKSPLNKSSLQCSLLQNQAQSGCQCCIHQSGFEGNFEYGCSSNNAYFNSAQVDAFINGRVSFSAYIKLSILLLITLLLTL